MTHQIPKDQLAISQPVHLRILPPITSLTSGQELAVLPPAAEHVISVSVKNTEEEVKTDHGNHNLKPLEHQHHGVGNLGKQEHSPVSSTARSTPSRGDSSDDTGSPESASSSSNLSLPTKATRVHSFNQGHALLLPNYGAMLNSFDGPVEGAELSSDFLHELQRLFKNKNKLPTPKPKQDKEHCQVQLLVPASERDLEIEASITSRLSEHLQVRYLFIKKKRLTLLRGMIIWLILGFALLYASTLIADDTVYEGLLWNLLRLVIDPLGWFMVWSGMDKGVDFRRSRKRVKKASALAQLHFNFTDYQVPAAAA